MIIDLYAKVISDSDRCLLGHQLDTRHSDREPFLE
jgi:hypothetical protein